MDEQRKQRAIEQGLMPEVLDQIEGEMQKMGGGPTYQQWVGLFACLASNYHYIEGMKRHEAVPDHNGVEMAQNLVQIALSTFVSAAVDKEPEMTREQVQELQHKLLRDSKQLLDNGFDYILAGHLKKEGGLQ